MKSPLCATDAVATKTACDHDERDNPPYGGQELTNRYRRTGKAERFLTVENLSGEYSKLRAFPSLRGAENTRVAVLDGSGRTSCLNAVRYCRTAQRVIKLNGKTVKNRSAREAIRNGLRFTEERRSRHFGIPAS